MTIEERLKNVETACFTALKLIEEMAEIISRLNNEILKEFHKDIDL